MENDRIKQDSRESHSTHRGEKERHSASLHQSDPEHRRLSYDDPRRHHRLHGDHTRSHSRDAPRLPHPHSVPGDERRTSLSYPLFPPAEIGGDAKLAGATVPTRTISGKLWRQSHGRNGRWKSGSEVGDWSLVRLSPCKSRLHTFAGSSL